MLLARLAFAPGLERGEGFRGNLYGLEFGVERVLGGVERAQRRHYHDGAPRGRDGQPAGLRVGEGFVQVEDEDAWFVGLFHDELRQAAQA